MLREWSTARGDNLFFIGALALVCGWAAAVGPQGYLVSLPSVTNFSAEVADAVVTLSWVEPEQSDSSTRGLASSVSALRYTVSVSVDGSSWQEIGSCSAPCNQYAVQRQIIESSANSQYNFSIVAYAAASHSDPLFIAVNVTQTVAHQSSGLIVGSTVAASAVCGLLILASVRISRLLRRRKAAGRNSAGRGATAIATRPGFSGRMSSHLPKELRPDGLYRGFKPTANESQVFLTAASGVVCSPEAASGSDLGYYSNYWRLEGNTGACDSSRDIACQGMDGDSADVTKQGGGFSRWPSSSRAYSIPTDGAATDACGNPPVDWSHAGDCVAVSASQSSWSGSARWHAGFEDGGSSAAGGHAAASGGSAERPSSDGSGARRSGSCWSCGDRRRRSAAGGARCCLSTGSMACGKAAPSGAAGAARRHLMSRRRLPRLRGTPGGRGEAEHLGSEPSSPAALLLPRGNGSWVGGECNRGSEFANVSDASLLGKVSLQDSFIPLHLFPSQPGKETTSPQPKWARSSGDSERRRVLDRHESGGGGADSAVAFAGDWADWRPGVSLARLRPSCGPPQPETDRWQLASRSPMSSEVTGSLERSPSSLPPEGSRPGAAAAGAAAPGGCGSRWLHRSSAGVGGRSRLFLERELSDALRPPLAYSSPASSQLQVGVAARFYEAFQPPASSSSSSLLTSLLTSPSRAAERYTREQLRRAVEAVRTKVPAAGADGSEAFAPRQFRGAGKGSVPADGYSHGLRIYDDAAAAAEAWRQSAAALVSSEHSANANYSDATRVSATGAVLSAAADLRSGGDGRHHPGDPSDADGVGRPLEWPSEPARMAEVGGQDRLTPTMNFYAGPRMSDRGGSSGWRRGAELAAAVSESQGDEVGWRRESPAPGPGFGWDSVVGCTFVSDRVTADRGPPFPSAADEEAERVQRLLRELHTYQSNGYLQHSGGGSTVSAARWQWRLETDF